MIIKDNIKDVLGYAVGQKVKCANQPRCIIKNNHFSSDIITKYGAGWVNERIFTIERISFHRMSNNDERYIFWPKEGKPGSGGKSGIYEEFVRPLCVVPEDMFEM